MLVRRKIKKLVFIGGGRIDLEKDEPSACRRGESEPTTTPLISFYRGMMLAHVVVGDRVQRVCVVSREGSTVDDDTVREI